MSYNRNLWDKALSALEKEYDDNDLRVVFNGYFKPLSPEVEYNGVLYVRTQDDAHQSAVEARGFLHEIENALSKQYFLSTGESKFFKICAYPPKTMDNFIASIPTSFTSSNTITLNPDYTFDSFVVGNSNKIACAASINVSERPGMVFNPLFIYGDSGLGKTHLMHATGNKLLKNNPNIKIIYITSESFMTEFIDSIRNKSQDSFKSKFRNADVLMIDDIQFIGKGDTSQEELFHTFNHLRETQKQIIFTCDCPPKSINGLEDRLVSRFQQGLIVQIEKPDFETRVAILKNKVRNIADKYEYHAPVNDEVLYYIASKEGTNIRELEGALNILYMHAKMFDTEGCEKEITMDIASSALTSFIIEPKEKVITSDLVIKIVCKYFDTDIATLKGSKRSKDIVIPRHIVMYFLYTACGMTYESIGDILGGRDHTTILNGVNKVSSMLKTDPAFKNTIEDIKHRINE